MYAHVGDDPPSLLAKRPDLPGELESVIATAMAKDSAKRYPSCGALIAAVRGALGEEAEPDAQPDAEPDAETGPHEPVATATPDAPPRAPRLRLSLDVDAAAGVAMLKAGQGDEQASLTREGSPARWVRRQ
jgi:serine/threonine-protein kinase